MKDIFVRIREIGVAGHGGDTARRLRTINVVAAIASALTVAYCLFYAVYDVVLFRREVVFLFGVSAAYAAVMLATRVGRVELAMWFLISVAILHLGIIGWLLGPRSGATTYLLVTPFIVTLLIRKGDRFTIWPVAGAVVAIFVVISFSGRGGTFAGLPADVQRGLFTVNVAGAVVVASVISLLFQWLIARAEAELRGEKARGDRLLRAILPEAVAEQLKADESRVIAERCESATVLLADIVGFTRRTAETGPDRLVADLNRVFSRADELAAEYGVERIKTLGDGYLAVCGLPEPTPDHRARMADFALALNAEAEAMADDMWPGLRLRTVIHTGPVVAGVIGRTKFAYDVWGDTVNTAARLEEVCAPGEILITEAVRTGLPERFETGAARTVALRDKGDLTVAPLALPGRPAAAPGHEPQRRAKN